MTELPIKFIIANDKLPPELLPGEVIEFFRSDNTKGLIICCPQCGKSSSGAHIWDDKTQALTPSIVHNIDLGGCGWHGHIINGKWVI